MTANGVSEYFLLVWLFLITAKMLRQVQKVKKKQNKTNPPFLLEAKPGIGTGADVEQMLGQSSQHKAGPSFPCCWPPGSILRIAHIFLGGKVPWPVAPEAFKRSGYWETPMPTRPSRPSKSPTGSGLLCYDRETYRFTTIQPGSRSFFLGSVCSPNIWATPVEKN